MPKPSSISPTLISVISDPLLRLLLEYCHLENTWDAPLLSKEEEEALLELAGRHGVLPLLYRRMKERKDTGGSLSDKLRVLYRGIARENMLMSAELLRTLHLFDKEQIPFLAIKGPALALEAYGDLTLRQFGDLDLLISGEDRDRTLELLESAGWQSEIGLEGGRRRRFLNRVSVLGLHHRTSGVRLELHWELFPRNYALNWDSESFWREPSRVEINGAEVPVPRPEMHLLYLCAHGAKHLYSRLEWLTDIDHFIRRHPSLDWSEITTEAQRAGVQRMLFLSLGLSRGLLGTPLPPDVSHQTESRETLSISRRLLERWGSASVLEDATEFFRMHLAMRDGPRQRTRFLLAALFVPKFDDFRAVDLPPWLAFAYPFLRPLRLARKYLSKS